MIITIRKSIIRYINNYKNMNLPSKCATILIWLAIFLLLFGGLVLESFNINIINFNLVYGLHWLSVILALIGKNLKLFIFCLVSWYIAYAITLALSEVLWYYLLKWFNIDIAYR